MIIESLVVHALILIDNKISVEAFKNNSFWMKERLNSLLLRIVHELLRLFVGFSTTISSNVNVVDSIVFRIILITVSHLQSELRAFSVFAARDNVEALTSNERLSVHGWLKGGWVNTALDHIEFLFQITVGFNPVATFSTVLVSGHLIDITTIG